MSVSDSSNLINGKLKVLVFGAGAIGTYIGGSLALAGHQVVFKVRQKTVDEIHNKGLRLDFTIDPRRNTKDVTILDSSAFVIVSSIEDALRYGPFDLAVLALKSYDTRAVMEEIKPYAEKFPPVVCFSNGVANESVIAETLGEDKVIYGIMNTAVSRRGAGDIILEKLRGIGIALGHPLSEKIHAAMDKAMLNSKLYQNAASMKWSKMFTNLTANPQSAILDMTAEEIFANKDLYEVEIDMLRECLTVMNAQNIKLVNTPGLPVRLLAWVIHLPNWLSRSFIKKAVGTGRGGKMPSFHIDLRTGRGNSEVEYLHGEVVRAGEKLNVPTPVNKLLTKTLMALTNGELPLDTFAHQPDKFLMKLENNE